MYEMTSMILAESSIRVRLMKLWRQWLMTISGNGRVAVGVAMWRNGYCVEKLNQSAYETCTKNIAAHSLLSA